MKKSKIYTRTGDKGETSLVSGKRISKGDNRIDLYGEIDELNSRIGFCITFINKDKNGDLVKFLHTMQSALFDLGSNMACEDENRQKFKLPVIKDELIQRMEEEIDKLDHNLPQIRNFILPGGTAAASAAHLCRTNARKVERMMINFKKSGDEELPANALVFLNRTSDYFFVLARFLNFTEEEPEIAWIPH